MNPAKTKDGVLFIHGNSSSSRVFEHLTQSGKLAFQTTAITLAGHGHSPANDSDFSFRDYYKQINSAIEQIEGRLLLVGNSLGGHLAIRLAPTLKGLSGICIFGTPPLRKPINIEEAYLANDHGAISFLENPSEEMVRNAFTTATTKPVVSELLIEDFMASNGKARTMLPSQLLNEENQVDEVAILKSLDCKKFILHGKNDIFANGAYIQEIAKESGANFTLFEDSGHYISMEEPDKFIEKINEICFEIFN